MDDFAIAVKSFIFNDKEELLTIKRRPDDANKPSAWEIPGGRLEKGENPFEGLKRETKEETGLEIEVLNPLKVHHFKREDGQKITMITFYCKPLTYSVKLSEEHVDYQWIALEESFSILHPAFHEEIKLYQKYFFKNH